MRQADLTVSKKQLEGPWEGRRGRTNKAAIAFGVLFGGALLYCSQIEITERPDDIVHGNFLKNHFSDTIADGIQNLGQRRYVLPLHLMDSSARYKQYLNRQKDIQDRHGKGLRDLSVSHANIDNGQFLADIQANFHQGMNNDRAGDMVVSAIKCDKGSENNTYDCSMVRAEIGGFDSIGGLDACSRIRDDFTVYADVKGGIDYISTKGAGYKTEFKINPEKYNGQDRNPIIDNIIAHIAGDFAYYAAAKYTDERNAVLRFSGCLEGGPQ